MAKNSGKNKGIENLKPFKKGQSGNPNGRPKGQRNYLTIYREALEKIADANDKTPEEIETMLEEMGIKHALKGNFAFWKDIRDRVHGKAIQPLGGIDGQPIVISFDPAFNDPARKAKGSSQE